MNHITELDKLTKATRRREFDDGLMDYFFGGIFLFYALIGWFNFSSIGMRWLFTGLDQNREIIMIVLIAVFPLFLLFMFGTKRMIERVRRKTLWKDQGFVKSLPWQFGWKLNALASAVMIAMVSIAYWLMLRGAINQEVVLRTFISSSGVGEGVMFYGMGSDLYLHRYKWVGTAGGILSTLIIFMPISFSNSWLALGIIWMIVFTISGSWALWKTIVPLREQNSA